MCMFMVELMLEWLEDFFIREVCDVFFDGIEDDGLGIGD